uniref:WGS project CBMI000000000 data, contig CS3069_c004624 n=1 Tax=Fusarium clavum TaxID=2594811 RepID=A0A090MEN7_9HYPO|nr:unnamed protein product [Fusarium clavum]
MSPQLEWNEFLSLYCQVNNSPSLSPSPRPILGFEQYLFSPEKIRETCNPRRTSPSRHDTYRGRATSSSTSTSSSSSRSSSTNHYVPVHFGRAGSYSPPSTSSSSTSSGSTHSYVPASCGRDRSHSPSASSSSWSSSSSRSSSRSEGSSTYGSIPPPEPDRHGNYVYLPLRDSLRILSEVQSTMEEACYYFAEKQFPEVLEEKEWDCPEAAELNVWVSVFFERRNFKLLRRFSNFTKNTRDLGELLDSMKQIRHSAVHRHPLTVTTIRRLVQEAIAFCRILGDNTRLEKLHAIWGAASIQIDQLYEKSQPYPPPQPSTLQNSSIPKLLPTSHSQIERSTEVDSEHTESDVDDRSTTTYSKEHLFGSAALGSRGSFASVPRSSRWIDEYPSSNLPLEHFSSLSKRDLLHLLGS